MPKRKKPPVRFNKIGFQRGLGNRAVHLRSLNKSQDANSSGTRAVVSHFRVRWSNLDFLGSAKKRCLVQLVGMAAQSCLGRGLWPGGPSPFSAAGGGPTRRKSRGPIQAGAPPNSPRGSRGHKARFGKAIWRQLAGCFEKSNELRTQWDRVSKKRAIRTAQPGSPRSPGTIRRAVPTFPVCGTAGGRPAANSVLGDGKAGWHCQAKMPRIRKCPGMLAA